MGSPALPRRSRARGGFTLVEMLVSTAIMLIVILVLLQVVAGMTNIWHNTSGQISSFQSARAAFNVITRSLSRATLKSYYDYIDSAGNVVTATTLQNADDFNTIKGFARSSDLWFMCGPTTTFSKSPPMTPANIFPGDACFFTAPLGVASSSNYKFLQRSLNFLGFYVTYNTLDVTGSGNSLPPWLETAMGFTAASPYRFRLMEYLENTDQTSMYNNTVFNTYTTAINNPVSVAIKGNTAIVGYGQANTLGENVVLAENIVLLIFRPRVEPADEKILATALGVTPYNSTTANSIISPNYGYDSRAWWSTETTLAIGTTQGTYRVLNATYASHMRSQLPPIVDVAMVAVDPNSIIRLGTTSTTPPAALQVSQSLFGLSTAGACNPDSPASVNMDSDLATFGTQLATNHIHYRIFRTSVQMEGAAWVDN
jgi:uncharacterized protein (TIGR02599 family)